MWESVGPDQCDNDTWQILYHKLLIVLSLRLQSKVKLSLVRSRQHGVSPLPPSLSFYLMFNHKGNNGIHVRHVLFMSSPN